MNKNISNDLLDEELRKFFDLCFESNLIMPMFSELIDYRWHDKIQDGKNLELPFHDTTVRSSTPIFIEWIPSYEAHYGKLNTAWFMDGKGNLLCRKYQNYLSSGKIVSSFNCAGSFI